MKTFELEIRYIEKELGFLDVTDPLCFQQEDQNGGQGAKLRFCQSEKHLPIIKTKYHVKAVASKRSRRVV